MIEFETVVTDIREHSRRDGRVVWQIALDRTEFMPGATGTLRATARSGAVIEIAVVAVDTDAGEVWHSTEKPLLPGATVVARVNPI